LHTRAQQPHVNVLQPAEGVQARGVLVVLGGVLVAAAALRLAYLVELWRSPLFWLNVLPGLDMATYFADGQAFATGRLPEPGAPLFQAPLYPLLLAGLMRPGGSSVGLLSVAQLMLGVLACGLLYELGRRLATRGVGLLAAGLYAAYPLAWYYGGLLLSENLLVVLLLVLSLAAVRALEQGGSGAWLSLGVVCGLASLAKPNVALVLPVLLLAGTWRRTLGRGAAGLAVVACGLVLLPPSLYNSLAAGSPQFVSAQGLHLWLAGNTAYATGLYQLPCGPPLSPSSGPFWWLQAHKLVLFWSNEEFGNNTYLGVFTPYLPLLRASPIGFGVLASLGLLGLLVAIKPSARWLAPLLVGATYCVGIVAFVVIGRYRLPVAALLCLPAAMLLMRVPRLLRRRPRRLALCAACVLALGLAANVSLPPDVSVPFAHANAATVFEQAGDQGTAQLERARAEAARQAVEARDPHACSQLGGTLGALRSWELGVRS
jgi:4-amino-4-deoxy-L-arabinose transferase-like glycosyltransferase